MVVDVRGQNIEIGSFIRYSGTGTISKVVNDVLAEVDALYPQERVTRIVENVKL